MAADWLSADSEEVAFDERELGTAEIARTATKAARTTASVSPLRTDGRRDMVTNSTTSLTLRSRL
jgi:hypothetical protein